MDGDGHVQYQHWSKVDYWVIPHCLLLLRKFWYHMNFEVASSSHVFQYLFKYIHKGMKIWKINECWNFKDTDVPQDPIEHNSTFPLPKM